MDLQNMTSAELAALKEKWYNEALQSQKIANCYLVGINLGTPLQANWGPKWQYDKDGLSIYVDNYGGYFTVSWQGKTVVNTHVCQQLYIPGLWEGLIDALLQAAIARNEADLKVKEAQYKQKLISQLSI